ncbi:hypothetical protein MTO96_007269 [Rhipicephalus appendiculatus]
MKRPCPPPRDRLRQGFQPQIVVVAVGVAASAAATTNLAPRGLDRRPLCRATRQRDRRRAPDDCPSRNHLGDKHGVWGPVGAKMAARFYVVVAAACHERIVQRLPANAHSLLQGLGEFGEA